MGIGRRALAEAIGTYFLVLIGPGAAMVNAYSDGAVTHPGVALAFAFVVLAMIYALGHISGAHINPAVTLAFWSVRRFPGRDVAPYVAAQCAGAVAASFTMGAVVGPVGGFGATVPAVSVGGAFAVEWLLSFVLMLVIVAVATDERVAPGFAGIAVGLTVGFCAMAGGPLTGASMNPARSLGPAVAGGIWDAHWIYWVAPITAMLVAVRTYEFLRPAGSEADPSRSVPLGVEGPISPVGR
ncbi:MIP family channel protein [Longimicrobium sp.]|uniref:MIP/aquaporin family protein n=1 Tax=Longimicrobium sp. TaxID=2029185 RepID=UPI002E311143|nr:MIP family channel protein [Longimicrobium sp.]HEX6037746.1 MIP family channel protein [Longimicrobium sp.]